MWYPIITSGRKKNKKIDELNSNVTTSKITKDRQHLKGLPFCGLFFVGIIRVPAPQSKDHYQLLTVK